MTERDSQASHEETENADMTLRSLSSRQEAILAAIPDIIMEVNEQKVYTWSNQAGLAFFGDDVVGKEAQQYFEGTQETYERVGPLFQGSDETIYVESWQRRRDGTKRLLAWRCRVLKDNHQRARGALSTARDITEERLAELHLRRINECLLGLGSDYLANVGRLTALRDEILDGTRNLEPSAYQKQVLGIIASAISGEETRRQAETERKELSEQLRASQKLEAIGHLAGGIAHDFNNMLAVIMNYAEFALENVREGDPLRDDLQQIRGAGQRASALTHQLLAFSRKQVLQLRPVDLNQTIAGMDKMLRRIIGEDIELRNVFAPDLGLVAGDSSQLEQAIMNLVLNARDAMPEGGRLIIETANVQLDDEYAARHVAVNPGAYAMLAVSDTGCGMDQATQARVFEPFFTLKGQKGSGLGLSTAYGIVKQSGGNIWVYSELGRGTTFKIYLPRTTAQAEPKPAPISAGKSKGGSETILLVEDEAAVRNLAKRILVSLGYSVLVAANGGEALLLCEQCQKKIHLLLTDVVMPNMGGKALSERMTQVCPGMRVLFMSGYTDDAIVHHGVLEPGTQFIAKPFSAEDLARKVREVLDAPSSDSPPSRASKT